jgi:glyoxylase-like metal-dependent hydrolase (beta-lactamase superfamily II)
MSIEQIRFGMDNFSYVIYCDQTDVAALVDPGSDASNAINFVLKNKLNLMYIINTHHHTDHTADNARVKRMFNCKLVASSASRAHSISSADIYVKDGDSLNLGQVRLKFIHTPGHTPDGLCVVVDDKAILTGDTLFIGDCGRCDLPGSSQKQMFESLNEKIKPLPDDLIIYPGHDYGDRPYDTLGSQRMTNKTLLAGTFEEFSKIE